jgi:hypothetical protein
LIDVVEVNAEEEEEDAVLPQGRPPCNAWRKKPVSCAHSEGSVRPNGLYPVSPLSFSYSLFLLIVRTSDSDVTHVERRPPMPSASRCNTIFSFPFLFRFSFFFVRQTFSYRVMYIHKCLIVFFKRPGKNLCVRCVRNLSLHNKKVITQHVVT